MSPTVIWRVGHQLADAQAQCGNKTFCSTGLPVVGAGASQVQIVLGIVFGIFGAVAVLMVVIAGLRFITANGNPQEVAKARSTMIYAVAGLVVALMAEAIVSFVLGRVK